MTLRCTTFIKSKLVRCIPLVFSDMVSNTVSHLKGQFIISCAPDRTDNILEKCPGSHVTRHLPSHITNPSTERPARFHWLYAIAGHFSDNHARSPRLEPASKLWEMTCPRACARRDISQELTSALTGSKNRLHSMLISNRLICQYNDIIRTIS